MTQSPPHLTSSDSSLGAHRIYTGLVGVAAVLILLQGVWAGLFIHEGQDYQDNWVAVHARGADLAIVVTIAALVVALWKLRAHHDLVIGTALLGVLLVLEAYLGGLIGDSPTVTAIHIPLAMALMGLCVWLPLRAVRSRRSHS